MIGTEASVMVSDETKEMWDASVCRMMLYLNDTEKNNWTALFFFNDTATTEIYTLSLHDALPICLTKAAIWIGQHK